MALENMENPKLSMQLFSILCNHNFLQKIGFVKKFLRGSWIFSSRNRKLGEMISSAISYNSLDRTLLVHGVNLNTLS